MINFIHYNYCFIQNSRYICMQKEETENLIGRKEKKYG